MGNQTWRFDGRGHEDNAQDAELDTLRRDVEARLAQLLAEDGRAAALSLDQGQDLEWAAETLQPRTVVQGNLAPETLLAGGAQLEAEVRRLLEALAGGPHIFNLGHGVLQGTPPEHVAALVAQVRAHSS